MLNIYKASAGSGKTYKLAYEYIRALLGVKPEGSRRYILNHPKYLHGAQLSNRHRYILAITFTNKATEEMKRRIVDELDALAQLPNAAHPNAKDANYAEALCQEFGCVRDELANVASYALRQLLWDYNQFSVTTIDSFFQRVLRTFARELDHQGDFSVELNDYYAVQSAVDTMLDDFNLDVASNPNLEDWIFEFMYKQLQSGKKSNFFNRRSALHSNLVGVVSHICEEKFKEYAIEMKACLERPYKLNTLKHDLRDRQKRLLDHIKQLTEHTMAYLEKHKAGIDAMGKSSKIAKMINNNFLKLTPADKDDMFKDGCTYSKVIEGETTPYNKTANVADADKQYLADFLADVRRLTSEYMVIDDIIDSLDHLMLLGYAWRYLDEFVAQNNLVLLSDTNHLLSRIIGNDDTPFIYERMGVQYHSYLIDEFQDTSRMQWKNLKPLVANGLSEDHDSLIIGDEKQSIYRFRNSDSSLLHTEVADVDFPSPRYNVEVQGSKPGENTNYRSAGDVVRFNNTLFSLLSDGPLGKVVGFENVIQDIPKHHVDLPGYVQFIPFVPPEKRKRKDSEASADQPQPQKDALDLMAENIIRQHEQGKYPWGDIAILVAKNDEGALAVERIVTKYPQIPVISDEALYVRKSSAVQMIIGTLEILANERVNEVLEADTTKKKYPTASEVALAISRFGYYRNLQVDDVTSLGYALNPKDVPSEIAISNTLDLIRQRKPSTLTALVETIVNQLISPDERRAQMAYINAFQDYVIDFCAFHNQSIRELLNNWSVAKNKLSISAASDIDAVKIMTIHKSKGLEFDCVHIPFGSWEIYGRARGQWLPFPSIPGVKPELCPPAVFLEMKDYYGTKGSYYYDVYREDEYARLIDTMNMTYVAYTRAGRELAVYYNPAKGIGKYVSEVFATAPRGAVDDSRLCALGDAYDIKTQALTLGSPTTKAAFKGGKGNDTLTIDRYDTYFHKGAEVLTRVEDMLDLDTDINDDVERDDRAEYEFDEVARQRGVALHDILSYIVTLDDIAQAVSRVTISHRLSTADREDATQFITAMLDADNELIYRWFCDNAGSLNEQSIFLPDSHRASCGIDDADGGYHDDYRRPDRIVFCNDGSVDVIDYKFTTRTRGAHRRQVNEYMSILKSMGYAEVRGYLWYPFLSKLIPCV